jgi:hypothetical protein
VTPVAFASGCAGQVNTGGGGGAGGQAAESPADGPKPGNNGGSGVVIVVEPQGTKTFVAGGIWSMEEQYDNKLAGNWTS